LARKSKLKKFTEFTDSLYPSEVLYVKANNNFYDPQLFEILERMERRLNASEEEIGFDESIDPRKYTKLLQSIQHKLSKVDVDAYFGWISAINHRITIDAITPEDQKDLMKELSVFESSWFHASSFYETLIKYRDHLLLRYRDKEYEIVTTFLEQHEQNIESDRKINLRIQHLTQAVVLQKKDLAPQDLKWLREIFEREELCKKTRYQALITFLICQISQKRIEQMKEPMEYIEQKLFKGEFYSRRILANFYANKLLMLNSLKRFEEAAFCGKQSIKHHTQDYLYYLNNYVSVLMHLKKDEEALELMSSSFKTFKVAHDSNRRVVFIANYCRVLNRRGAYNRSIRYANNLLDELGETIFQSKWNYFFRVFFDALLKSSQSYRLLRIERKYNLVERERQEQHMPYLAVLKLGAGFQELKISEEYFKQELSSIRTNISELDKSEMKYFFDEIEKVS
jgi:hypothetical protein